MTSHITNDSSAQADEDNGYNECGISIVYGCTEKKEIILVLQ